ncbi:MAG: acyltransferase domain-containing protein [Bacillota bacterium]|nr:acyltransferase domain-containing protein [Bacillota bacterium]
MNDLALKWYKILNFPEEFDSEFESNINRDINLCDEKERNLIDMLCRCEALKEEYTKHGIPEDILMDTLSDIVCWSKTCKKLTGKLGLIETFWISKHMDFKLFKLGRLQFTFGQAKINCSKHNLYEGDNILEIHIQEGGPLTPESCIDSIKKAEDFFHRYFPEYDYKCFTCHSWLLNEELKLFLKPDSNILKFQKLYDIVDREESDNAILYIFRWGITKEEVLNYECSNNLQKAIQNHVINGGKLYIATGIVEKNTY